MLHEYHEFISEIRAQISDYSRDKVLKLVKIREMINSKCKICRRAGAKLFLKGEKCFSPKCLMIRKPYPPGKKRKRRFSALSEYGKELREKQRLRNWYNLSERQFKKYVKETLEKKGGKENMAVLLLRKLESRFDNVVFRLGFTYSRPAARQMVSHNSFLLNGKPVNIPSLQLKTGDIITIRPSRQKRAIFQDLTLRLKKHQPPSWIHLDKEKIEGRIIGLPTLEETSPAAEISAIFELYSR